MSDTLRLQTNVPEVVSLEFAEGLPVSSKFGGDQVMFSLTDGRRMYLPPFAAQKLSGIRPGVPFRLCKREVTHGNRRTVEYQVETAAGHPVKDETATLYQNAAASKANQQTPSLDTRVSMLPTQQANAAPAAAPAQAPAIDPQASSVALMKMAGIGAIDAVLEIEKYAQSRGLVDFIFGPENVQKVAVTLFLEMSRKAGRAA